MLEFVHFFPYELYKVVRSQTNRETMRKTVCVQGLGFVGAAMATAVAVAKGRSGQYLYNVIGVELPTTEGVRKVQCINRGEFPLSTVDKELISAIKDASRRGNLTATVDQSIYSQADIIVVDVAQDISLKGAKPNLDLSSLKEAIRTIGKTIEPETLVVIETTVPPGTCENVVVPILESELRNRELPENAVHVAHSYERVMPGANYLDSIINYWRIFSGYTTEAATACRIFLETVINTEKFPLTQLASMTASETAKVLENSYRAANIAFIDEWTKFSERIGIDLHEVVEAIAKRPTHSNIRYPGLGVGGYCLTKDPMFTPIVAEQIFQESNLSFPVSHLIIKINQKMPFHVLDRISQLFSNELENRRILVCGISYRPDIGDTRYSPSEILVREMRNHNASVILNDPYVNYWAELQEDVPSVFPTEPVDGAILAVAHKSYIDNGIMEWLKENTSVVVDAAPLLTKNQRDELRNNGVCVESIGRGDGL